jgi:hypothetical protein
MTVTELRDALNALIEQGHGDLIVAMAYPVYAFTDREDDEISELRIVDEPVRAYRPMATPYVRII